MVTNTLSLVLVSMVSVIWFTRRLTIPATVSKYGTFQFSPASATRRNFPKRVITATCAVFTVKKLPRTSERTMTAMIASTITSSMSISNPPPPAAAGNVRL